MGVLQYADGLRFVWFWFDDASGFLGNITADFAADLHDGTVKVTGGQQATDSVTAVYTTAATYTPSMEGVESLVVDIDDNITVSLAGSTGLGRVSADLATSKTGTISDVGAVDSRIVIAASGSTLEVVPVDATDEDNAVNVSLSAFVDANSIVDGVKIKTTDVETVNITALSSESVDLSAIIMSTATDTVTLNVLGSAASPGVLTASATAAQITTINAAGAVGFIQTGRSATTAVDYTGSIGNDTFIMMTAADKIAGGAGTSDTLDVNYGAVLGGISVDLSASGEQISTLDGGAISGSVTGFENVDLSGYTGFGASVTAIKTGSTITGTASTDRITLGAGADTIVVPSKTPTGADVVNSFTVGTGKDKIDVAALAEADFDTAGANIASTTGFVVLGGAGDAVASLTADLATAELSAYDVGIAASEEFFFAVDDGVSTGIFFFADADGDATADAGESVHIMTLVGISDATTIIAANVGL